MNKPYDEEKWAEYLQKAKKTPYLYKIQAFGSVILKRGQYLFEKHYVYSEFITAINRWVKKDETTLIIKVEGSREAEGLIAFQVEMKNYNPITNPNPYQWYLMPIKCVVPKVAKNVLLTMAYAWMDKKGTLIQGGFAINEIDKGVSQKLDINKPSFKGSGDEYGWISKGKPYKTTTKEIDRLFEEGKLLAVFAQEDWGRHGKTTVLK